MRTHSVRRFRGRVTVTATLQPLSGPTLQAQWYGAAWIRNHLSIPEPRRWLGTTDSKGRLLMPRMLAVKDPAQNGEQNGEQHSAPSAILSYGLRHSWLPELFSQLPKEFWSCQQDPLAEIDPVAYQNSLRTLHQPLAPEAAWQEARRHIAYRVAVGILARTNKQKQQRQQTAATAAPWPNQALRQRAYQRLPYQLSTAQQQAADAIEADPAQPYPMQQLPQGDVGCGKTAVAFLAACQVIAAGQQVAWLAPTGVVAAQHAAWWQRAPARRQSIGSVINWLYTNSRSTYYPCPLERWRTCGFTGTHAIIPHVSKAPRLGLAICDEEHKFGVEQRQEIMPRSVHALTMSATPIPRSLALGQWGAWD